MRGPSPPPVGAVSHLPWVCTFGAMAVPGMLPVGPVSADQ